MRTLVVTLGLLFGLSSCVQAPVNTAVEPLSTTDYTALIERNTQRTNQYNGFHQTFQADATLLTTEVQTATLKQRAAYLQWDRTQYQTEREKVVQDASAYAKVFLRFYVAERDYDDLSKPKTIWKAYLEVNGTRLEGKIKKMTEKLVEIQTLYPNFDRFSTPYEITFNVPMATAEQTGAKFTLTSSLGTAEFTFPTGK